MALGGLGLASLLRRATPVGKSIGQSDLQSAILDAKTSPSSGPPGASLYLAVFTDYRCPACRRAFLAMDAAVGVDRDVRLVYKDWPIFGPPSERAARVALATAEQGIYPAVHRMLMTDGRAINDDLLREIVTRAGGNWSRALVHLKAQKDGIDLQLRTNAQQAFSLGLPGTPGYLAGQVLVAGAIDKGEFIRLFAQARAAT
nr:MULTISPECIES: DsbA family protein [Sphingomonas]